MNHKMNQCYLGLGANIGDKSATMNQCRALINERIGLIVKLSSEIVTKPWGKLNQDDFLNQVILVETSLSPTELLEMSHQIEQQLGRVRSIHWGPRVIDIDILFYNQEISCSETLCIPHLYIADRLFVLESLAEIAPQFVHPVLNKTMTELLKQLTA